jgi:chromate transport protein ChrA
MGLLVAKTIFIAASFVAIIIVYKILSDFLKDEQEN